MKDWIVNQLEISHGSNQPLKSMEGLRGFAVFLVFLVHYSSLIEPWVAANSIDLLHFIHSFGNLGVDLFFVLSGFLIYGTIISKKHFAVWRYAARRAQRIYPTFLAVFLLYIFLSYIFPSESKIPQEFDEAFWYIVQNVLLLPGIFDIDPIITVAWSLSFEVFYYLVIPVFIFALRLKRWSPDLRTLFWIVIAALGFLAHFLVGGHIQLLMFIGGILLFELHSSRKNISAKGGWASLLIALFIFGIKPLYELQQTLTYALLFVLFPYFCSCAFNPKSSVYEYMIWAPLRWLGNMSYSYYLIHGLTLQFCFVLLGDLIPEGFSSNILYYWLWIPLFVPTLIASFGLFVLVERPFSLSVTSDKSSRKTAPAGGG